MERSQANARLRRASERLYGDSGLRDSLTDEQAEQLLAWGFAQVEEEVVRTRHLPDEDAAPTVEVRTEAVHNVLRLVNEIVAQLPEVTQARSHEYMGQLVNALCEVDSRTVHINDILALEKLVTRRADLARSEIFDQLLSIIQTPAAGEASEMHEAAADEAATSAETESATDSETVTVARRAIRGGTSTNQEEEE